MVPSAHHAGCHRKKLANRLFGFRHQGLEQQMKPLRRQERRFSAQIIPVLQAIDGRLFANSALLVLEASSYLWYVSFHSSLMLVGMGGRSFWRGKMPLSTVSIQVKNVKALLWVPGFQAFLSFHGGAFTSTVHEYDYSRAVSAFAESGKSILQLFCVVWSVMTRQSRAIDLPSIFDRR